MSNPFDIGPEGHEPRDPMRSAESGRALPKRFYKAAAHERGADGAYLIQLDGRPVKTPAKAVLAVAEQRVAAAIVAEWAAQGTVIDPATMPVTRLANSAIDGVAQNADAVRAEILNYAGTDLLCYRAGTPERLVALQDDAWNPLIDWMHERFGARFLLAEGIVHVAQFPETIEAVDKALGAPDALELAALSTINTLTGSAILTLAVLHGRLTAAEAWAAAHVDEDYEISLWGEDDEATARREARWREFQAAALVLGRD
ncbi:Chaperone required for the assembly of the F1-ATPase [Kaistia soli DSM 19436]|uniref:Chaperone required for the assembly of the F1-ATPase n=1 Tax=Kaistia soli DSM 19436 TaxID=1122133 RepID=A0A1M5H2Z3_9HYPH|nr:ATP12 family protein [Kaistia soli]SHG10314.1 Chaperone required for the assembly of the F1-ATPase [Kaistia soli DSM 19436]